MSVRKKEKVCVYTYMCGFFGGGQSVFRMSQPCSGHSIQSSECSCAVCLCAGRRYSGSIVSLL